MAYVSAAELVDRLERRGITLSVEKRRELSPVRRPLEVVQLWARGTVPDAATWAEIRRRRDGIIAELERRGRVEMRVRDAIDFVPQYGFFEPRLSRKLRRYFPSETERVAREEAQGLFERVLEVLGPAQ